ncbi:hypothetical protein L1S35_10580 [Flavobacterium sp. AS60]|uniref:hypothetical protein n=1 Tax=Flavobacterium anseongense TaxID=2910677 RepID=UPI001F413917|nr:hypothetical protein [Flavobacterium sp. AS60]MCF6130122.1 hypothetical protein [Flavobacterium sp. AS60]
MAKSNGILKIEGTIEDLTFYKKDGKNFVRRKGGVSKERIANDPNFVRTRENNSEFTITTGAGKSLRLALGSLVFKAKDTKMVSRLVKTMSDIKKYDTVSARGNRQIYVGLGTPDGKLALQGFDFNANAPLSSVLFTTYELDTATGVVTLSEFIPLEQIRFPEGATNVSIQSAVLGIDFETEVSELALSNVVNLPLNLTPTPVTLTPTSVPTTTGVTLFLLAISFFQEVNGQQYSLKNEEYNVLHIVDVI